MSLNTQHSTLNTRPVAVTAGEPAGIGPDLCIQLAAERLPAPVVVVADRDLLVQRARLLERAVRVVDFDPARARANETGVLCVVHVPLEAPVTPGSLDPANSRYVLRTLEAAADG